ncbi:MAG: hypothetical protein ACFFA8_08120 [Promethearchaeota archaeon]
MKVVMCKECGLSIENKEPGNYYCENCAKEMKFFQVQAFCGAKPDNELYEHNEA